MMNDSWGGQSAIAQKLLRELRRGRVVHAYLLVSPTGAGASLLAMAYAKALLCTAPTMQGACGRCPACVRFDTHNHPDFSLLTLEKKASIGVEEIRTLTASVQIKPYEGGRRVVVIDPADKLTVAAQNALLKTLEEPPGHAVFLLVADKAQAMLPTVRSRVRIIELARQNPEQILQLLQSAGVPGDRARVSAALSDGWAARAFSLSGDDAWFESREHALSQLLLWLEGGAVGVAGATGALRKNKDAAQRTQILSHWLSFLRDIAALQAAQNAVLDQPSLLNPDHQEAARRLAASIPAARVLRLMQQITEAKRHLQGNASAALTADLLMLAANEKRG